MKLLFDQNLSYKLVNRLADVFPKLDHVRNFDLGDADDAAIWEFARQNGYTIVSKDEDFASAQFRIRPSAEGGLASCRELFDATNCGNFTEALPRFGRV